MSGRKYWTRSMLAERLVELGEELDRVPQAMDVRAADDRTASYGTYLREFGSWEEALAEAGFGSGLGRRGQRREVTR